MRSDVSRRRYKRQEYSILHPEEGSDYILIVAIWSWHSNLTRAGKMRSGKCAHAQSAARKNSAQFCNAINIGMARLSSPPICIHAYMHTTVRRLSACLPACFFTCILTSHVAKRRPSPRPCSLWEKISSRWQKQVWSWENPLQSPE